VPLTTGVGMEGDPILSPDGSQIAFTGEYDGNIDVFVTLIRWHTQAIDVSSGARPRYWLDARREAGAFLVRPHQLLEFQPAVYAAGRGRVRYAASVGPRRCRRLLTRRRQAGLHPDRPMAESLETLSRRSDHAHLDRHARRFEHRQNPAQQFERLQSYVGRRDHLLSLGPQRAVALFAYDTKSRQVTEVVKNDGLDFKSASAGSDAIM